METLPLSPYALVWSYINCVCDGLMANCQTKVSYGAHTVLLNQYIFRLEVPMSDARFTFRRIHQNNGMNRLTSKKIN